MGHVCKNSAPSISLEAATAQIQQLQAQLGDLSGTDERPQAAGTFTCSCMLHVLAYIYHV